MKTWKNVHIQHCKDINKHEEGRRENLLTAYLIWSRWNNCREVYKLQTFNSVNEIFVPLKSILILRTKNTFRLFICQLPLAKIITKNIFYEINSWSTVSILVVV